VNAPPSCREVGTKTSFVELSHRNKRPRKLRDVPNIVEYDRRATWKVKLYGADADNSTVLRVADAYGIEGSSRIRSELRVEWSHVVRSARIEEPTGGVVRRKQNFCFGRACHVEDVRIILRSDSYCAA
jgi:hypothetical protein